MVTYKTKEESMAAGKTRRTAKGSGASYEADTGKPSAFTYPDGRTLVGLSPNEISFLNRKYADYKKPETPVPEVPTTPAPTPITTPEQQAMVGTGQPNFKNTPVGADPEGITSSILENQQKYATLNKPFSEQSLGRQILGGPVGMLQSATGLTGPEIINLIPGVGKKVANVLGKNNPDVKSFITNYSNEDSYDKIKTNIETADAVISASIQAASDPKLAVAAMYDYEEAMNKKRRSMEQLRLIADKDQGAYVDNVRKDLTVLQNYFDSSIKRYQDAAMQNALLKANMASMGGI